MGRGEKRREEGEVEKGNMKILSRCPMKYSCHYTRVVTV